MDANKMLKDIADKEVDIDHYAQMIIADKERRGLVVENLLYHKKIMVYYHCYYIVSKASETNPEIFYMYWTDFAKLLNHENSYHRDFGLTLIANLCKVDTNNYFAEISHKYFAHLNDEKFMTAECLVENLKKILHWKSEYEKQIVMFLCDIDTVCTYSEKQRALLKGKALTVLESLYGKTVHKGIIMQFANAQLTSISPKTRKIAKEFVNKYN